MGNKKLCCQSFFTLMLGTFFLTPVFAFAAPQLPSTGRMFQSSDQVAFTFTQATSSSPSLTLYLGAGVDPPSATVASVPAPCVLPNTVPGLSLDPTSPITDSTRRDLSSCALLFPFPY